MTTFFVSASPTYVDVPIGQSIVVTLTIGNTSSLIDSYLVRVFGLDKEWVLTSPAQLSLFPAVTGDVTVTMQLPDGFPAGMRQLSIQVQSENDPGEFTIIVITINVAAQPRITLAVDPSSITGGNAAQYGLVVTNNGNSIVDVEPSAIDPEDEAAFAFMPVHMHLLPGEQAVVQAAVRAPRPWIGQPKVRVLTFTATTPERREAVATFVQRPRIGRWLISLLGLITAAAVFAAVLSHTFSGVVDEAKVPDAVVNEALNQGGSTGERVSINPSTVAGKVVSATDGQGIAGVQAQLFLSGDGNTAISSAASGSDGSFAFGRLSAGVYRVKFSGAGFSDLWYPSGRVFADATDVPVEAGGTATLVDTRLSGLPGTVQGKVAGDDLAGATATLLVTGLADPTVKAVVAKTTISADGSFALANVPTPADYTLIVEKPGSALESRDVKLGAAADLSDLNIQLRQGDGIITGHVFTGGAPLGGVTVEATDGTTKIDTVSLTVGDVGQYTLRNLATPKSYTVTVSRPGFITQSRTLSVDADQPTLSDIVLTASVGAIRGTVVDADGGKLGGVSVTVTGGDKPAQTSTISQGDGAGTWSIDGLPVPRTYTVTFAKTGYVSQTRLITLDGSTAGGIVGGVDAALVRNVVTIRGTVTGRTGNPVPLATITLTNGTTPRTTYSANDPPGAFAFDNVPPGSYTLTVTLTGAESVVQVVTVRAGEPKNLSLQLGDQASLSGLVLRGDGSPFAGVTVRMFTPTLFATPAAPPVLETTTGADGSYSFNSLNAPADFVVAVYLTPTSVDALDSELVSTVPGQAVTVPTFTIRT